jgi:hypothetical protein
MAAVDQQHGVLATWRTSCRVTAFLIESLPDEVWRATIPGAPRRTVRMIGGHLHNCRCMWVQNARQAAWSRGSPAREPAPRVTAPAARRPAAECSRHQRTAGGRPCERRPPRWILAAGGHALPSLPRGTRGSPPRANRHGSSPTRPPPAGGGHRRPVAMVQARARSWEGPPGSIRGGIDRAARLHGRGGSRARVPDRPEGGRWARRTA